jgi:cell division septation protein DedD
MAGGPALSLPIFDGGRLRNQLARSDAEYDLAVAQYNQTLVGAVREVTDAVQSARSFDAQIVSATRARDAAQQAWDIASKRYRAWPWHATRRACRAAPAARPRQAAHRAARANAWPHPSTSIAPSAAVWSWLLPI